MSSPQRPDHAEWLQRARGHLRTADPVLARLIDEVPGFDPRAWLAQLPPMDLFGALLFQVAGQQLSVPAHCRVIGPIVSVIMAVMDSASWRKIGTLRDLAERFGDGRLNAEAIERLPDEEIIALLTEVPGIGPWTAQGVLIIALDREDVVLPGDLALRKAIRAAYRLDHLPSPDEVLAIAERWRPYRSLGSSYLFAAAYNEVRSDPAAV